ncbi:hypothetical protein [Chryseobacterium vrystaatense]|uniref:Uncharacterized protein n=1 Tax=Chryseobacterium vrystaatense TaxID=307480 RepID=A0A1M4ZJY0_9FLAO|nr:hypothetical protein [Chryseobacterium vrystaatense]SHF18349.1 hypothetical protein SAMN02787073_1621 [Chryseobacterium vrystaatense]
MNISDPKEFVRQQVNGKNLIDAEMQHRDLSYFTQSSLQENITVEYLRQWVDRKYSTNEKFLNWVKTVFKSDNFLSFYKYLRFPLPSARIINDDVKPQLRRVYHADDSVFKYIVKGQEETCHADLNSKDFDNELFDAILFNHNAVVVQDIDEKNRRYREIISVSCIVSVECDKKSISRIAYRSSIETESGPKSGYSYIDSSQYIFFDREYNILMQIPHDLGECPADWISSENMFNENYVVKKSIFSYIKNDLEEYVFLKTLQKMTEPNGAIPIVTQLKTKDTKADGNLKKTLSDKEPMSPYMLSGSVNPAFNYTVSSSDSQLQAGTIVKVPAGNNADGTINMDVVKNYFQFHYLPVESLEYLNDRINEIESNIKACLIGDFKEQNEAAKNEMQVSKGYDGKEDILRWMSEELSRIKQLSDYKTLALLHGKENVSVEVFFGTDFFIESLDELYTSFKIAPNSIERRKILKRISQVRNKHNLTQAKRDVILYMIIPYVSDLDFNTAKEKDIDPVTFEMQTRFDHWIALFEAQYGQIEMFYEGLQDMNEGTKIILIKNLIKNIITNDKVISNT